MLGIKMPHGKKKDCGDSFIRSWGGWCSPLHRLLHDKGLGGVRGSGGEGVRREERVRRGSVKHEQ
jgi:hypothetical protein